MPARDAFHDKVKNALIKDGWTITHDPFTITYGNRDVFIDLGAERAIAAEKGDEQIAVEIKMFQGASDIRDFEVALGQFLFYRSLLIRIEPHRTLFLAVSDEVYGTILTESITQPALEDFDIAVVVFDPQTEEIVRWTK